ncbi:MAG: hypothetical protein NTW67_03955, partial [Candidatus Woesearchaeota archaeon]|nr:hypothetical protein [Candidatus Woesearchaeota archaeon]
QLISQGLKDGRKRALFVLINFLTSIGWSYEMTEKYLAEWNKKNGEPLREVLVQGQLRYHKMMKKKILPPNCDNKAYMADLGVCKPDAILIILILAKTTIAQDACNNEYNTPSISLTAPPAIAYVSPTDSGGSNYNNWAAEFNSTTEVVVTAGTTPCEATSPFGSIAWDVTDPGTDAGQVEYTYDGLVAVAGWEPGAFAHTANLHVNFYTTDGTVVSTFEITYPDRFGEFTMTKSGDEAGGIFLAVTDGPNVYVHLIDSTGELWQNASTVDDASFSNPVIFSDNNGVEVVFKDSTNYRLYDLSFQISGTPDKIQYYAGPADFTPLALYRDYAETGYITLWNDLGGGDPQYPLILLSVTDSGGHIYDRVMSSANMQAWIGNYIPKIIPFNSDYVCFGAEFTAVGEGNPTNKIFCVNQTDGVVDKEIDFDTTEMPNDIAASTDTLYVAGRGDTGYGSVASLDYDNSATNWNYNYESDDENFKYDAIALGTTKIGLTGHSSQNSFYATLLDLATGSNLETDIIIIEGHGNPWEMIETDITSYFDWEAFETTNDFFITGYDKYNALSGYTGRLNGDPTPSGTVPEFSITTLLIALLIAGGLLLVVRRKR